MCCTAEQSGLEPPTSQSKQGVGNNAYKNYSADEQYYRLQLLEDKNEKAPYLLNRYTN